MYEIRYRIERDFYGYEESEGAFTDFLGDDVLTEGVLNFTEEQWCGDGVSLRLFTVMLSQLPFMTEPLNRRMDRFEWTVYETRSGKLYEFEDECSGGDTIRSEVDYALVVDVWRAGKEVADTGEELDRLGLEATGLIEADERDFGYEY